MTDIVAETAQAIKDMRVRGAGRIARAGASAMGAFAEGYKGVSIEQFRNDAGAAAKTILASRPTAVSLRNGVLYSVRGLDGASTLKEAVDSVVRDSAEFVESSSHAVERIAEVGAQTVRDGDVILTHCNSNAAVGVIKRANAEKKNIKVYATETRPWRQGLITSRELAEAGVDVTLIVDGAVRSVMGKVDRVFVGADTVASDGSLYNKVGTSQIALAANELGKEFSVCTETYKFSPLTLRGEPVIIEERGREEVASESDVPPSVKVFNPVFDRTPAKYISSYITENGIIHPGAVFGEMLRLFGTGRSKE
ncbi:MAG: ribose 1,5-bisphosphate isomerase [Candidatus Methanoplasma sp.]|nr:ribose 1,5-bisphosphate isomerase [Candidatus Methanoplasma sp.]